MNKFKKTIIYLFTFLAALSLTQGFFNAIAEFGSQDFQYSAARMLLNGENAYDNWQKNPKEFLLAQAPNYLPILYFILTPIATLDWVSAKTAWATANLIFAIVISFHIYKAQGSHNGTIAALVFLSSLPVRNTIGNGQHSIFITLVLIFSFLLKNDAIRSLLLSTACAKYSIGAYFAGAILALCRFLWKLTPQQT